MTGIIDYGMGNIHSVQKALESLGGRTAVINKAEGISACDKLVLPGVGAFDDAMLELKKQNLAPALIEHIAKKKIFLGICLGMQLLFQESEEGELNGLSVLKGRVKRFDFVSQGFGSGEGNRLKVPHMGWNQIEIKRKDCPLFKGLADNSYVYFCHSYYPKPVDDKICAATTNYGGEFASIVWQDNVYGAQFHPEKSQDTGMRILRNFVSL